MSHPDRAEGLVNIYMKAIDAYSNWLSENQSDFSVLFMVKKVKLTGWLIVGISQTAWESIPFLLAQDQWDYFEVERHTYHQLPTLPHRSKPCYSYAVLARAGIEPGTLWFVIGCSTDWTKSGWFGKKILETWFCLPNLCLRRKCGFERFNEDFYLI